MFFVAAVPTRAQKENGINLSLWKGVSTQKDDTSGSTLLNIGLLSSMNRLEGVGLNILGGNVREDVRGAQISGIFNTVRGHMLGMQVSGITSVNAGGFTGISISGLFGIHGKKSTGLSTALLGNMVDEEYHGLLLGGLANVDTGNFKGIALAGLGNLITGSQRGMNLSALLNVTGGSSSGILIAGIGNINAKTYTGLNASLMGNVCGEGFTGLQLSVLANVTTGLSGMQIGAVNIASEGKGVQVGLYNYHHENFDGLQLGLINANPSTRLEAMLSTGSMSMLSAGLRFKNSWNYTILSLGVNNYDLHGVDLSLGYRAGIWYAIKNNLSLSGDLGIMHDGNMTKKKGRTNRIYSLQARVNLEYQFSDPLSLFLSGGYQNSRDYHGHGFSKGLFLEAGTFISLGN